MTLKKDTTKLSNKIRTFIVAYVAIGQLNAKSSHHAMEELKKKFSELAFNEIDEEVEVLVVPSYEAKTNKIEIAQLIQDPEEFEKMKERYKNIAVAAEEKLKKVFGK